MTVEQPSSLLKVCSFAFSFFSFPSVVTSLFSFFSVSPPLFPTGRLYQVEYAMEAISQAGSAVGILANDGIILAAEKRITSKLLDVRKPTEKMYKVDDHISYEFLPLLLSLRSSFVAHPLSFRFLPQLRCRWYHF
jgi:hypothetical protein